MKITNDSYKVYSGINFKNVYLDNNRIMTMKEVDRYIKRIALEATIAEKVNAVKMFIKRIFNK